MTTKININANVNINDVQSKWCTKFRYDIQNSDYEKSKVIANQKYESVFKNTLLESSIMTKLFPQVITSMIVNHYVTYEHPLTLEYFFEICLLDYKATNKENKDSKNTILKYIQEGDLLILSSYLRTSEHFYYDGQILHPIQEGKYIPSIAWPMIVKNGIQFFFDAYNEYCVKLPFGTKIKFLKTNTKIVVKKNKKDSWFAFISQSETKDDIKTFHVKINHQLFFQGHLRKLVTI